MAAPPPAPPSPLPRDAEQGRPRAGAIAAAALLLLAAAAPSAEPKGPCPEVMMMTGLPLVWGERGPFDPASRPAAAYVELSETFSFKPVDVLDPANLGRGRLLFMAQPQRLAPSELAALDGWVRRGGRALILTDPMLTWPSELPPGDIRRPPPVGLLGPLLDHWGLALEPPAEAREVAARWNGWRILLEAPGRFRSSSPACVVGPEEWMATCRVGRGLARLVADADLMRDSLWAPRGPERRAADNPAVVGEWLDALAGIRRERPRMRQGWTSPAAALVPLLLAAATGAALLLRRRRKR